ncbi:MAG: hypothetical protein EOP06_27955, partial [Proteobacteria bacterium]
MLKRFAILFSGVLLIVLSGIQKRGFIEPSAQLLVPPSQMKFFTFGYQEVVADSIWLRVIQDFDTCGKMINENVTPIEKDPVRNNVVQRVGKCERSWAFQMIDSVTELAPKFRMAYATGAVVLSVAVDDVEGAARIFDKAVLNFG